MTEFVQTIPPVFVLSSGRCGSTMLSSILNSHPDILSLSEFFAFHGMAMFRSRRMTGDRMWKMLSRQSGWTRFMLRGRIDELLYPVNATKSRFSTGNVPPILCTTLPHITDQYEELFDDMEPVVRGFARQATADQLQSVFRWLCRRTGSKVWVERSGGSAIFGSTLVHRFPDARIVHMYRDGRDTALSMMHHATYREIMVYLLALRQRGYDPLKRRSKHSLFWDTVSLRLQPIIYALLLPRPIPSDRLRPADFGTLWSDMVRLTCETLDRVPADRVLNLCFEDIVARPEQEIRRLLRFVDPALENGQWVKAASNIPRSSRSKVDDLEPAERQSLTEACRPGLERLGYSL